MVRVLEIFGDSGMTLEEIGTKMGYSEKVARRAAWQFLRKTSDPHISMLRRFADAMKIDLESLVSNKKKSGK